MTKTNGSRKVRKQIMAMQIVVVLVALFFFISSIVIIISRPTPPPRREWPPAGSLNITIEDSNMVRITFQTFSPRPDPQDIKVIIENTSDSSDLAEIWFGQIPDDATVQMNTSEGITAYYTDLNYLGNEINAGDYIIVDGLNPKTGYRVLIYYYPTDSLCPLVGDTSFELDS